MKEGWEYKKLGEVCLDFIVPQRDKPISFNGDIPWCRIEDIEGKYLNGSLSEQNVSKELADKMNMHICPKGTVICACSASIGNQAITTVDCYTNQTFIGIVPKSSILYNEFLYYFFRARKKELLQMGTGATIKYISKKKFQGMRIGFPPLSEQQRIVEELDLLSSIIEKKKEQLKELDNLAQSIFYDMFGDPVNNEKGWVVMKLEEMVSDNCPISYGIVQPGNGEETGIPVVRPVDLRDTFTHNIGLKLTSEEISNSYKRTILKGNELLLCVRGTTGIVSLASKDLIGCNVSRGITPLEFNSSNNRFFMLFQFKTPSIQYIIADLTHGIALKGMNMSDVRKMKFIQPPLSLQQQFASKIESIEQQKELIKQSITEVETLFNSRMDYYFN